MFAWIPKLLTHVPGIGTVIDKLTSNHPASAEADKLRAEAELADMKGFHKTGRISAGHFWKYTKSGIAVLLAIVFSVAIFVPSAAENVATMLGSFIDGVTDLFKVTM